MRYLSFIFLALSAAGAFAQSLLIEAESFQDKGGWVVDPQFVEQMGSPYLLAHGLGEPVENAVATVNFKEGGKYHVWVRTKNWVPGNWTPPGRFRVKVANQLLAPEFGKEPMWGWEYGGDDMAKKWIKEL